MGKGNTNYGLTVSLNDAEANAITMAQPAGTSATDKISLTAGGLLRDLAKGGVMLAPEWASRIQNAIGGVEPMAIVDHVEMAVGKSGESTRVEWIVDPTQIQFYQEQADHAGTSLAHQLKAHMDYAFANGWLGSSAPDPFKILLTQQQYRQLQQMFKRDIVTGEDVINRLLENAEPGWPAEQEEEVDPIMASLRSER